MWSNRKHFFWLDLAYVSSFVSKAEILNVVMGLSTWKYLKRTFSVIVIEARRKIMVGVWKCWLSYTARDSSVQQSFVPVQNANITFIENYWARDYSRSRVSKLAVNDWKVQEIIYIFLTAAAQLCPCSEKAVTDTMQMNECQLFEYNLVIYKTDVICGLLTPVLYCQGVRIL